jgi:hypothetical protein
LTKKFWEKKLRVIKLRFFGTSGYYQLLKMFFAGSVYNEQLYSLIVWSKVAPFFPWAKKTANSSF